MSLDEINAQIAACQRCPLAEGRSSTVPGEGAHNAEIMFVGEAPGQNEDETGRPFVGRAGELLDELIAGMGMRRKDVFIANMVKCRPPANRNPEPAEMDACKQYLDAQIAAVDPVLIVTLGKVPLYRFAPGASTIGSVRGRVTQSEGRAVLPTYHPAYALRSPDAVAQIRDDLSRVPEALMHGIRMRMARAAEQAEQSTAPKGPALETPPDSEPAGATTERTDDTAVVDAAPEAAASEPDAAPDATEMAAEPDAVPADKVAAEATSAESQGFGETPEVSADVATEPAPNEPAAKTEAAVADQSPAESEAATDPAAIGDDGSDASPEVAQPDSEPGDAPDGDDAPEEPIPDGSSDTDAASESDDGVAEQQVSTDADVEATAGAANPEADRAPVANQDENEDEDDDSRQAELM